MTANLFTTDNHGLPTDVTSFGEELQHAGYKTGYIGKWHLSNPESIPPRKNDEQYIEKGELVNISDWYPTFTEIAGLNTEKEGLDGDEKAIVGIFSFSASWIF